MQLQPANYICETMPTRANSGLNRFVLQAFHWLRIWPLNVMPLIASSKLEALFR